MLSANLFIFTHFSIFLLATSQPNICQKLDGIAEFFMQDEMQNCAEYNAALANMMGWNKGKANSAFTNATENFHMLNKYYQVYIARFIQAVLFYIHDNMKFIPQIFFDIKILAGTGYLSMWSIERKNGSIINTQPLEQPLLLSVDEGYTEIDVSREDIMVAMEVWIRK